MRTYVFMAIMAITTTLQAEDIWKFKAYSSSEEVFLNLDLYKESIPVPEMEIFGPMNGYINGKGIYGVWMITSVKITSPKEAIVHFSNDLGSETQIVKLSLPNDTTCVFEQLEGNVIKKAIGRNLVKIPKNFQLKIKK